MAERLAGRPVAVELNARTGERVRQLAEQGIIPTLAILRVGEKADDLSYERSAIKALEKLGIRVTVKVFPEGASAEELNRAIEELNRDQAVHGILPMRPLVSGASPEEKILPIKDIDGCTPASAAALFEGKLGISDGFAPCTAEAVLELLKYYGVPLAGKRVTVLGRSAVIGRPAAMLLLQQNATVTVCHSKTENIPEEARRADVLVAATGRMESVDASYTNTEQTVIDVGIGWNERKQKLTGDVDYDAVEPLVRAITPVPGGVGAVTTAVLAAHVAAAAARAE